MDIAQLIPQLDPVRIFGKEITGSRARLLDGRPSPAQDRPLWRTLHRPLCQRGTKKEKQRLFEEISNSLPHRPSPVVRPSTDRQAWRHTVRQSVSSFETACRAALGDKRSRRKNRAATSPTPDLTFPYSRCGRIRLSRIGLNSHQRACIRRGQRP